MPIGSAEDRTHGRQILNRFLQLCGGPGACIAVIPTACVMPVEGGAHYCNVFGRLGAAAHVVDVQDRRQANDPPTVVLPDGVTGIFMIVAMTVHVLTNGCASNLETRGAQQPVKPVVIRQIPA